MTYRVFIGMWDPEEPDRTDLDERGLSWEEARERLGIRLRQWGMRDDFPEEQEKGRAELARLQAAEPGPFEAEVWGDDYMIMEETDG